MLPFSKVSKDVSTTLLLNWKMVVSSFRRLLSTPSILGRYSLTLPETSR